MRRTVIRPPEREKADPTSIDPTQPLELAVLAIRDTNARSLLPGTQKEITLRAGHLWDVVPGDVVRVRPKKVWSFHRHPYVSGTVEEYHLNLTAFGLTPLGLRELGLWDPREEYWSEEGELLDDWARSIRDSGPRPEYELERVVPGEDPEDPECDPIIEAIDLVEEGAFEEGEDLLMDLLQVDLRCLDAHAHLGNFSFRIRPEMARRHYEVGVRIGDMTLGSDFKGVLPWAVIENRPFLRCLHGYGLCLWRLKEFENARRLFERLLWLNPSDNQGARLLLPVLRDGKEWTPEK